MTSKTAHARRHSSSAKGREIHIPHSSWTRVQRPANAAPLAPEDFWARLGL